MGRANGDTRYDDRGTENVAVLRRDTDHALREIRDLRDTMSALARELGDFRTEMALLRQSVDSAQGKTQCAHSADGACGLRDIVTQLEAQSAHGRHVLTTVIAFGGTAAAIGALVLHFVK